MEVEQQQQQQQPTREQLVGLESVLSYYSTRVQIPLLSAVTGTLWVVVGLRCWGVRKRHVWKSQQGLSTGLILLCSLLCTVYFAITVQLHVFFLHKVSEEAALNITLV